MEFLLKALGVNEQRDVEMSNVAIAYIKWTDCTLFVTKRSVLMSTCWPFQNFCKICNHLKVCQFTPKIVS
jgi:hypothetical protein